jgi:hypothetical protein
MSDYGHSPKSRTVLVVTFVIDALCLGVAAPEAERRGHGTWAGRAKQPVVLRHTSAVQALVVVDECLGGETSFLDRTSVYAATARGAA